jgi:hypothetical protein
MRRSLPRRHHRLERASSGPPWRFTVGLRAALLAVVAQLVVSVVHQFPHEHRLSADVAAAAAHGHQRDEHDRGPTPNLPDPQACIVGQMLQHLAAVLPLAGGDVLPPDWDAGHAFAPSNADAVVVRLNSPAQPRAPPLTA